jgi:hypothetical protein
MKEMGWDTQEGIDRAFQPAGTLYDDQIALKRESDAAEAFTAMHKARSGLAFDRMTSTGQVKELRRQINNDIVAASEYGPGEKERAEHLASAYAKTGELRNLMGTGSAPEVADQLARLGGFAPGAGNVSGSQADRALAEIIRAINEVRDKETGMF